MKKTILMAAIAASLVACQKEEQKPQYKLCPTPTCGQVMNKSAELVMVMDTMWWQTASYNGPAPNPGSPTIVSNGLPPGTQFTEDGRPFSASLAERTKWVLIVANCQTANLKEVEVDASEWYDIQLFDEYCVGTRW